MQTTRDIIIDTILLAAYLIVEYPSLTGLFIHEWVSIGLVLIVFIHTIFHWDWTLDTLRCFKGCCTALARWNLVIDIALFVVFMIVVVSGIMVSRYVLFSFGFYAPGYFFWKPIHAIFAEVLLALVIVHIVIHWRWIFSAAKKNTMR
jgi:hypothetical protein